MSLDRFSRGILQTGFPLEHLVGQRLRSRGWVVTNSKHYVDDVKGEVREIDIVARKSDEVGEIEVWTIAIASCKKTSLTWAMLSRPTEAEDSYEEDHWPQHLWTNDPALQYMLDDLGWETDYTEALQAANCLAAASEFERSIFAFQQMKSDDGSPKNDTPIFECVTSLLKAQAYEIGALHGLWSGKILCQFNLLSVLDGDLIRLDFEAEDSAPQAAPIDRQTYLARYIIDRKATTARIRFARLQGLDVELDELDRQHEANVAFFRGLRESFFPDALADSNKRAALASGLLKQIGWRLTLRGASQEHLTLGWNKSRRIPVLRIRELRQNEIDSMNGDAERRRTFSKLLEEHYKYSGDSEFELGGLFSDAFDL